MREVAHETDVAFSDFREPMAEKALSSASRAVAPLPSTHCSRLRTARQSFVVDRLLTTYTAASFPFPVEPNQADETIELCR